MILSLQAFQKNLPEVMVGAMALMSGSMMKWRVSRGGPRGLQL